MDKYIYTLFISAILFLGITTRLQQNKIEDLAQERDLYLGQTIALEDSVRTLMVINDSLVVAARFAMPGEDEIDEALEDIPLPPDIDRDDIDQVTEITYLPKADTLRGDVRGEPLGEGLSSRMRLNIQTHELEVDLYQSGDLIKYAFFFYPKPQKITILNRNKGPVNERIVYAPGRIVDIQGFDRESPATQSVAGRRVKISASGVAHVNNQFLLTGFEFGPRWKFGPFHAEINLGAYQIYTPGSIDVGKTLGGSVRIGASF